MQWAFIHALLSRVPFALAGLSCLTFTVLNPPRAWYRRFEVQKYTEKAPAMHESWTATCAVPDRIHTAIRQHASARQEHGAYKLLTERRRRRRRRFTTRTHTHTLAGRWRHLAASKTNKPLQYLTKQQHPGLSAEARRAPIDQDRGDDAAKQMTTIAVH